MIDARPNAATPRRYEMVEAVLRRNIENGRLPPGLVLLEGPIAEVLQVSRAPVQRALLALETEGLVHRFDGRGFLAGPAAGHPAPRRIDFKSIGIEIPADIDEALQSRGSWERIYDTIERDIAMSLVFGRHRLIEAELAQHFQVSRTVVRDVLGRLQERGLIHKNQSSHWVAGPLTAQTLKEHFALRQILEPPALLEAAPRIDREALQDLYGRLRAAETAAPDAGAEGLDAFETSMVDTCVLATPNARLAELIRANLFPLLAAERLLRQLGLPGDRIALTEHRMIVELLLQNAPQAAAAMLKAHIEAAAGRNIAQMKIVAVIPAPATLAPYLTRDDR